MRLLFLAPWDIFSLADLADFEKEGRFAWKSTQNRNAVLFLEAFHFFAHYGSNSSAPAASSVTPSAPETSSVAPASSSAYVSPWDAKMVDLFSLTLHGKELPFIIEFLGFGMF